ncbi:YgaP family membrane protein [Garciella nitratireducens]|uniref:Inner membrane protein YgaP-like transmembrane domain-containing protein n=1 Tax=Garciella nitratireducens DSM 15102 TaxID=1121911 RepID=A0A1T4KKE9_9FIRM|nr:DUF2892 domain-containing protein [Garciella nitratireducens]RBP41592.1 DUF2892 family protein [Garciella nitratireducens]SJZ42880.1 Protein of unknown function [Garciella nitratireducens DSM 15102]
MEKNVGTLDSYLRITIGLTMLGTGILQKSLSRIVFGSGKVAEGVTRFCPALYLMGINTKDLDKKRDSEVSSENTL